MGVSDSEIGLTWNDNASNEDGFELDHWSNTQGWLLHAVLPVNTTAYMHEGLEPGTTHYYRVRAFNASGSSGGSNTAHAKTLESECGLGLPLGAPTLTIDMLSAGTLLVWSGVAGASGYDLVQGDLDELRSSGGDFALATKMCLENNRPTRSLVETGTLQSGEGTWFLVRGQNCNGNGTYDSPGLEQLAPRDGGIADSGSDCP